MNIKTTILAVTMIAVAGSASASSTQPPIPVPKPVVNTQAKADKKPIGESCKIIKGKKKCHKSPYKSKMTVEPYKGKPPTAKKTK